MSGILKITDGTTSVTLLANLSGVFVEEWRPQSSQSKGGGVWAESPFADGRQLVLRNRQNVIDTFNNVKLMGGDQDIAISNSKMLISLFEKAIDYWIEDWQSGMAGMPVWIEYRGECETNTSYAYLYDYSWPEIQNPHDNPFRRGVADELTLILEHGEWRDNPPGSSTAVSIYAGDDVYGTSLTSASTTYGQHFCVPYYDDINISHVYLWDNSAAAFSANVVNTYPQDLFTTPVQANDAIYYGSDHPFGNIVHTLSQQGVATTLNANLEYWNGAAWTNISTDTIIAPGGLPLDFYPTFLFTSGASVAGTYVRTWGVLSNWAVTAVNGVNNYWVRLRVTSSVGQVSVPVQATRRIYSVRWPWIEVPTTEIEGDLPAYLLQYINNFDHDQDVVGLPAPGGGESYVRKLIVSSRSISRGDAFTGYISFGSALASTSSTIVPYNAVLPYTQAGAAAETNIFQHEISTDANDWLGEYRVFVRYRFISGAAVSLRLSASFGSTSFTFNERTTGTFQTDTTAIAGNNWQRQLDLGTINITNSSMKDVNTILITLYAGCAAAASIELMDIVLIPIDEMSYEIEYVGDNAAAYMYYNEQQCVMNSTLEKHGSQAFWVDRNDDLLGFVRIRSAKNVTMKPDTATRIFVFSGYDYPQARIDAVFSSKLYAVQRYIFARGDE